MKKIIMFAVLLQLVFIGAAFSEGSDEEIVRVIEIGKIGVGVERTNTTADELTSFSTRMYILKDFRLGGLVGFNDSFNEMIIGPQLFYDLYDIEFVNIFSEFSFYYRRGLAAGDGIGGNLLAGLELSIPKVEDLKFSFAYGFVWDLVDQEDFGVSNNVFGNFGIHYYF